MAESERVVIPEHADERPPCIAAGLFFYYRLLLLFSLGYERVKTIRSGNEMKRT